MDLRRAIHVVVLTCVHCSIKTCDDAYVDRRLAVAFTAAASLISEVMSCFWAPFDKKEKAPLILPLSEGEWQGCQEQRARRKGLIGCPIQGGAGRVSAAAAVAAGGRARRDVIVRPRLPPRCAGDPLIHGPGSACYGIWLILSGM